MHQAESISGPSALPRSCMGWWPQILYFLVGAAVLVAGFLMVNLLTPERSYVSLVTAPNAIDSGRHNHVWRWPSSPSHILRQLQSKAGPRA